MLYRAVHCRCLQLAALALVAAAAPAALGGSASHPSAEAALAERIGSWRAGGRPHPLLGHEWVAAGPVRDLGLGLGRSRDAAADGRSVRRISLLGEIHDNAEHHKLRAALVRPAATGAVVLEQLRTDQQPAIDDVLARPESERTLEAFLLAVEWERSGWSKYDYRPLLEAVLAAGLPIYAGDAPRELIRKAAREGPAAISPAELSRLGLDVALDPELHAASLSEIEASHCGAMPKSAFGGMAFAQRLRDATLADVALSALAKHGAVIVIAGNGHVRSDRGVPWYIRQRAPAVAVSTTMLVEVEDGKTDAAAYLPLGPDGKPAADTLIFTPRADRDDPCKAFGKPPAAPRN